MWKIKLNCNKVKEFREEKIANSVLYWFGHSLCLLQSSSNSFKIFTIFINSFTTSESPRDTFPSCSEKLTNQHTHCLLINNNLFLKYKRCFSLFKRRMIQLEELIRILIDFASVWSRISFERAFDNEVLWNLSHCLLRG